MSIWRAMRASSCGNVWSIAFKVTDPVRPESMSIWSFASRASANRSSCAGTRFTTTLYVSGRTAGCGFGTIGATCTGGGIVPSACCSSARICVDAGVTGAWPHPPPSAAPRTAMHVHDFSSDRKLPPAARIARCSPEESLLTACQAGIFRFLLDLTAELREAPRNGLESRLVARRKPARRILRLRARFKLAEHHAQPLPPAAANGNDEHLLERYPVAGTNQKALHARRIRVVGHEKLDGEAGIRRMFEHIFGGGQAFRQQRLLRWSIA